MVSFGRSVSYFFLSTFFTVCSTNKSIYISPRDKNANLGHGITPHHLLASELSSASAAQVVNSIVDAGVAHMATSGLCSSSLISPLNNASDPTNSVIQLLSSNNSPKSFQASHSHNVSTNLPPSLPLPPPPLTQTHPLNTIEHANRAVVSLLPTETPGSGNSNSIHFPSEESLSQNSIPSPTEGIENTKDGALENGGGEHSPKYISL